MIRSLLAAAFFLATLSHALPQGANGAACVTTTTEVIDPTYTYTFDSTALVYTTATTPEDLGTFTLVETLSSTTTLSTVTTTSVFCTAQATTPFTVPVTETVYVNGTTASAAKRSPAPLEKALFPRQNVTSACTVTETTTTTYGVTETYLPASVTSTVTEYTAFDQETVTSTKSGATAYEVATATITSSGLCGPTTTGNFTSTTTQDAKCAPTALVSAYNGYGLTIIEDTPSGGGATFFASTIDASSCCQLCVENSLCAAMAYDPSTQQCRLEYPVDFETGQQSCAYEGLYALYDAGPEHPLAPGAGYYVQTGCGSIGYFNAPPDDGT